MKTALWPDSSPVSRSSVVRASDSSAKVIGSIPVGDSVFFSSSHAREMVNITSFSINIIYRF